MPANDDFPPDHEPIDPLDRWTPPRQYTVRKVYGAFRADPIPELRDHSRYPAREYELDETEAGPLVRFRIVGPKVIDPHWAWHDRFGPADPFGFFLKERERYLKDPKWIVTDKVAPDEVALRRGRESLDHPVT